jgi:hypothetical protein
MESTWSSLWIGISSIIGGVHGVQMVHVEFMWSPCGVHMEST